jgi:serine phosphatase RsbU (regulator of sigma subunit)/ligand-binding sensor protein
MSNQHEQIKIEELLDLDVLRNLLEGFAATTGFSVIICRPDGKPLTPPSLGNKLCRKLHERDGSQKTCLDSMLAAARNISRIDNSSSVKCVSGASMFASPIEVEDQRVATIVVCDNPCKCFKDQPMEQIAERTGLKIDAVRQAMDETSTLQGERMDAAVGMIRSLATTLAQLSLREYQLKQRLSELTLLHDLTSLLAGRSDLDQILKIIAQQVVQAVQGKGCSIRIYNPETKELQIKAIANLSDEYLRKGALKLADSPIDQSALRGEPVQIENMLTDPRVIYKKEAEREGLVSGLAVGMIYRGQSVGVIHLYGGESHVYERFEVECLKAIASQAASAIINAQLYQESLESERMQRQLKLAGEVQRRMLPKRSPKIPGIEVGAVYEPTYLVGGDYYDFLELSNNRLVVAIADVVGKGVPASLQVASLKSTLRAYAGQVADLESLVSMTDRVFRQDCMIGEFATLFIGILDPATGIFEYVNAGHYPALLVRDSVIDQQEVTGPALAIFDEPEYKSCSLQLQPSDKIVLYTDGFLDAMNFDEQSFGLDRVMASVRKHANLSAQKIAENVLWDVRRFVGLATQADDMSMVVIKYVP